MLILQYLEAPYKAGNKVRNSSSKNFFLCLYKANKPTSQLDKPATTPLYLFSLLRMLVKPSSLRYLTKYHDQYIHQF